MYKMLKLIQNEAIKLLKKKGFYISISIMTIWAVIQMLMFRFLMNNMNSNDVIEVVGDYSILGVIDFLKIMVSLDGGGSIFSLVCMFALATVVPSEFKYGTIKLLLIRAHSRTKILLSKFIVMLLYILVLMLCTIIVSAIIGAIFFPGVSNAAFVDILEPMSYSLIYTAIYTTIVFMISVLTKSSAGTIGSIFGLIIVQGMIMNWLKKYEFAKYILFYHTNLGEYEYGPIFEGQSISFSVVVIVVYVALMIGISLYAFNKRDVA